MNAAGWWALLEATLRGGPQVPSGRNRAAHTRLGEPVRCTCVQAASAAPEPFIDKESWPPSSPSELVSFRLGDQLPDGVLRDHARKFAYSL
jgi:hypothetical protein